MKLICFSLLLAFIFSSCEKTTGDPQRFFINLNECKQKVINDESAELCFNHLQDSRCPLNANCVWQGAAKASFTLKTKKQTIPFELSTLTMPPQFRQDTVLSGYKISLKNVYPYPGAVAEPIRAKLEITKQ